MSKGEQGGADAKGDRRHHSQKLHHQQKGDDLYAEPDSNCIGDEFRPVHGV